MRLVRANLMAMSRYSGRPQNREWAGLLSRMQRHLWEGHPSRAVDISAPKSHASLYAGVITYRFLGPYVEVTGLHVDATDRLSGHGRNLWRAMVEQSRAAECVRVQALVPSLAGVQFLHALGVGVWGRLQNGFYVAEDVIVGKPDTVPSERVVALLGAAAHRWTVDELPV